ncbi:FkbM family methyltransferase [Frigidibacter sp. ROC022]|uniref:FkbM family methyltransferase n=1 Tax=Frigidibacter sp. ROC022 TaxID=2971796 RepID=UPI00215A5ECE|nr:FkbM family methyltransferase [Frigidibacter sp. ROC022]MCR8725833.1 FkbM family methyltransferase [Frigidibacter sp. ROC022]
MNKALRMGSFAAECHGVRVPDSPFLHDRRIARINSGNYESQEINGALHVVRPGDRVLELGAGLGIVGAVVARNAQPSRVLSYEANPALIPHIRRLYRRNGLDDVISVRNAVLVGHGEDRKSLPFHVRSSYLGSSLIDVGRPAETVEVATEPLIEVMTELSPDVLIIDIEGGELDILRSAYLSAVRACVIEFHPEVYGREGMVACKTILREAGLDRISDHSTRTVWTCERLAG